MHISDKNINFFSISLYLTFHPVIKHQNQIDVLKKDSCQKHLNFVAIVG